MADDAKCQRGDSPAGATARTSTGAAPSPPFDSRLGATRRPVSVGYWSTKPPLCRLSAVQVRARWPHPSPPKQLLPLELSRYLARRVGSRAATALAQWLAMPPPPSRYRSAGDLDGAAGGG